MTEALISRLSDQGYNLVIEGTGRTTDVPIQQPQCFNLKVMKQKCTSRQYRKLNHTGMATVFLTNFIRCRTSFRMLFRLSLTMSLLGCDDLRQELTVKVRLPR